MFNRMFGQYLLNQGLLTPEQLYKALELEKSVHVKIGILAINAGLMTAEQVEEIHGLQMRFDEKFGALAVKNNYLTPSDLEALLETQRNQHVSLSQAILDLGYMDIRTLDNSFENYRDESAYKNTPFEKFTELKQDELVRVLLNFEEAGDNASFYHDYVALLLRNMTRFLDEDGIIERVLPLRMYIGKWMVHQRIEGNPGLFTALILDTPALVEGARRFSHENLTQPDELTQDSIAEFLNVNNGLFTIHLSNQGIETQLQPQAIQKDKLLDVPTGFCVPIMTSFGQIDLILAPLS